MLQVADANLYGVEIVLKFNTTEMWQSLIQVAEFRVDGQHYIQALVGRDILRRGTFVMSPSGHFTLCL